MQKKWRPAMGWMYMLICLLDMGIFPILWAVVQTLNHQPLIQWNPLTLQGAGLFHIAMGAVLGISAFGRTQEKLAGTAANPTATSQTTNTNMTGVPSGMGMNNGMGGAGGFGGSTGGFGGAGNGGFGGSSMGSTPAFGSSPAGFGAPTGGFGSPAPTSTFGTSAPSMAKPTPMSTPAGFGTGLDPSDPPTRNTRNDGLDS
jgi:hypothetical protein